MLEMLIISILCGMGAAIVLVEKRFEWPIKYINVNLRLFIHRRIHRKFKNVMQCSVCLSFWTPLICDLVLLFASGYSYFLWPMSGFAASGLTWIVYETINSIEERGKKYDISNYG